ncbi:MULTISPECIES: inositol monophosphatase family protein [Streptomyces]|uniref:inositol-phosphate phosphatase n=2 Tax=Streptomyces TaxID=1883 RepID=A0AA89QP22_STRCU|nr:MULTISPECIES: inositol monophosphatase family protein [Streptomyces]MBB5814909.1 fructose-1,6-bisphosphatase/inositol monophosphatase family enzyme [Streptomyces collinus]MEC7057790.1 inositol monophosphatase family protein [Streptomyces violaceochromogenes]WMX67884.1 inositol monophosphatase family protein [Streptomyces collinus]GHC52105.1 inositol monophosphatase [Streptomyces violaceochromogenes]
MIDSNETIEEFLAQHASDVEEAIRKAAASEIMPRWRRLAAHEVDQKSGPHDLVTDADRKAELYLTEALVALLPGSVVVGEEAVHANPASYGAIRGDAPVWIVDPVDGTRQFVRGEAGFCTLVALAHRGTLLASWTYAPARDRLATAQRGKGAHLDGERLFAGAPEPGRDLRVATSHPDYTTDEEKHALLGLGADGVAPRPCGSAGLEYLAIARGESDAVAFSWEAAWDHAAGLLLVEEAGGTHLTLTGEPFRIAGGNALPFTAARDAATARRVVNLLSGGA